MNKYKLKLNLAELLLGFNKNKNIERDDIVYQIYDLYLSQYVDGPLARNPFEKDCSRLLQNINKALKNTVLDDETMFVIQLIKLYVLFFLDLKDEAKLLCNHLKTNQLLTRENSNSKFNIAIEYLDDISKVLLLSNVNYSMDEISSEVLIFLSYNKNDDTTNIQKMDNIYKMRRSYNNFKIKIVRCFDLNSVEEIFSLLNLTNIAFFVGHGSNSNNSFSIHLKGGQIEKLISSDFERKFTDNCNKFELFSIFSCAYNSFKGLNQFSKRLVFPLNISDFSMSESFLKMFFRELDLHKNMKHAYNSAYLSSNLFSPVGDVLYMFENN